jgi:signal transduction histidine kinase/CheY-like chemotaxis protein
MRDLLKNKIVKNLLIMSAFGILSLILGEIKFQIPGFEGVATDLREVAVFVSVLYLPNWIYLVGVSIITSLTTPADGSVISTIITHILGSLFAYFFYHNVIKKIGNNIYKGLVWVPMIVFNYYVILLPTLVLTSALFHLISINEVFISYLTFISIAKYEIFTTTAVTSLFLISFEMRRNLIENNLALLEAKNKAEESDKLKTSFLENISHEIRTPLNAIVGFSDVLIDQKIDNNKAISFRKIILDNSEYLLKLINQIIDFAKIESKFSDFSFSWQSISSLIEDIQKQMVNEKDELEKKNIQLNIKKDDLLENIEIKTEQFFITQMIMNLIHNSIKFTSNGTIDLLFQKKGENKIRFSVKDTGIGISKDHLNKIFDRFYQVDNFQRGVGLSLTLSKRMVDLLKGDIWVESDEGKGASFYVEIPVEYKEKEVAIEEMPLQIELFNKFEKEVLIAEDEEANYQYLKTLLDQQGIASKRAVNGEEAIKIMKDHIKNIGLILMDIKMPRMDGITATREIRAFAADVPVIMQSAYDLNDEVSEAYKVGCNHFLTKPISKSVLISTLNKFSDPKIA